MNSEIGIDHELEPPWVKALIPALPRGISGAEDRMRLALDLALQNIVQAGGGPFASVITVIEPKAEFANLLGEDDIIALGVNRVLSLNDPTLHGEIVAIKIALRKLTKLTGKTSFSLRDFGKFRLTSSAAPCGMCATALIWGGISVIESGASKEAVEEITGFDEGVVPEDLVEQLAQRGIAYYRNLLPSESAIPLKTFIKKMAAFTMA